MLDTANTSEKANELLKKGANKFHCVDDREYHQVKDKLQNGVALIEQAIDAAKEDDVTDARLDDMKTIRDLAADIANGDKSLRKAQDVEVVWEFGLGLMLTNPEACSGYGQEVNPDTLGLKIGREEI